MPGQAIITINDNQWQVSLATTYAELTTGLSGIASLVASTGMLFVLGTKRQVTVDTSQMMFPLDIIFISESIVIDVASDIQPGYLVTEETPCDMFLEVNAGEAAGVEVGDTVSTATIQQPGFDWSQIISFAIPVAALGFVCAMAGGVIKLAGGSSSSPKQLPQTHTGAPVCTACGSIIFRTDEKDYETPQGIFCYHCVPKIYRSPQYQKVHKVAVGEHHSMWLTPEQRKELEKKCGAVAVRWAEEATRPGDIKGVETAAEYYYKKIKEAFGLGHLSPELSEEQIMKLREVLELPKEVPPREKGYIE